MDRQAFEAQLATLGFDEESLVAKANGTLFLPLDEPPSDEGELPNILDDLELKHPIGSGGMGVVHLAHQRAVRRDVAVKRAHAGQRGAAASLIVEARVTGALEHPNVIPIYGLGVDDDGDVLLVMKRVTGVSWASRLMKGTPDLSVELGVLVDVCRAVHFAHEKGLVHRDLKPSNVMIGDFGEVYVLDWGLAASIGDRHIGGVPVATEITEVTGTPAYMAPEMVLPSGAIDRRTDVFLLGGCLHKLVTGSSPFADDTVLGSLHKASEGHLEDLPSSVDEELTGVLRKALARDKAERYASADALGQALEAYRSRAAVRDVVKTAQERVARIAEQADDDAGDAAAQRAFDEARFGFEFAKQSADGGGQSLLKSARTAHILMAERELRRGRAESAALILKALRSPPADLLERVERERKLALDAQERVAELEHARNLDVGAVTRSLVLGTLGPVWLFVELGNYYAHDREPVWWPYVTFEALALGTLVVAGFAWRRYLLATEVGRQLATIALGTSVLSLAVWSYAAWIDMDLALAHGVAHLVLVAASCSGLGIERRLAGPLVLQVVALVAVLAAPDMAPLTSGWIGGVALSSLAWGAFGHRRASDARAT